MDNLEQQLADLALSIQNEPLLNPPVRKGNPPPVPEKPKNMLYTVNRSIMITDSSAEDNYSNVPTLPLYRNPEPQPGISSGRGYIASKKYEKSDDKYYDKNFSNPIALPPSRNNTFNYNTPLPYDGDEYPLPPPPTDYLPPPPDDLLLPPPPPSEAPSEFGYTKPPQYHFQNQENSSYNGPQYERASQVNSVTPSHIAKSNYIGTGPSNDEKRDEHSAARNKNTKSTQPTLDVAVHKEVEQEEPEYDDEKGYGPCANCGENVEEGGCIALNKVFHNKCFKCVKCGKSLYGKVFFELNGQAYCDDDFLVTLEKCAKCSEPIKGKTLRATGKPYHPECFCCAVCRKSLAGVSFILDHANQPHCAKDFYEKYAPKCWRCNKAIIPESDGEDVYRMVALDHSFHVKCFNCEDCGVSLITDKRGACYPLDDHIFCKNCNAKRIQALPI